MTDKRMQSRMALLICTVVIAVFIVMTVKVYPVAIDKQNFLNYSLTFHVIEDWKIWFAGILTAGAVVVVLFRYAAGISVVRATDISEDTEDELFVQKKIFRFSFLCNIVVWGCALLLFFPGTGMNDTVFCMKSPVNSAQIQPLIFEAVVYWGMRLFGMLTGNSIAAHAMLVLLQMLFCAWTAAYAAAWMYRRKVKASICYALAAVFALSPVMADYTVTLVKDTVFAFLLLLLLIQSYDLVCEKQKRMTNAQAVKLALLMIFTTLFRSNGIAVVFVLLLTLFLIKNMDRKKLVAVLLAVIAASKLNGAVVSHYHTQSASFRETTGVLTQQMAAVIARDGTMSEEEAEFLNRVLPLERWREWYIFDFVDRIKFHPEFDLTFLNEHKAEYVKTWYSLLKKNFNIYVDAYLFHTYQLWNVAGFDRSCLDYTQSVFVRLNNNETDESASGQYLQSIGLKNDSAFPQMFVNALTDTFVKACELNLLLNPGCMICILILCTFFLLAARRLEELIFILPQVFFWLIFMMATPAGGPFRYSYYLLVCLPFSILLTWKAVSGQEAAREVLRVPDAAAARIAGVCSRLHFQKKEGTRRE